MGKLIVFLIFLFSVIANAQQDATIHIFREGHYAGVTGVAAEVDGVKLGKLGNHKMMTIQVAPGYHEILAIMSSRLQGIASLQAEPAVEYFFQVIFSERGIFNPISGPSVSLTVNQVNGVSEADKIEIQVVPADVAAQVLKASSSFRSAESEHQVVSTRPIDLLSDAEVQSAILQGNHDLSPAMIGLRLRDETANLLTHALSPDYAVSGFSAVIFTPRKWIEYNAALAKKQMRPFSLADVTTEMRSKRLRVVALPSTPDRLTGPNMSAAANVAHVVICDKSKKTIFQPVAEIEGNVTLSSALRDMDYRSMASAFDMRDVRNLQGSNGDDEWYVVVIGDGEYAKRKFFKIKEKFGNWL